MDSIPKYQKGDLIKASDYLGLVTGIIVGVEWDEKVSEFNKKVPVDMEEPSENEEMWLYTVEAIGRRKAIKIYEDDIHGKIEVSNA